MWPPFDYFEHRRTCRDKQHERSTRIRLLPSAYHSPICHLDRSIRAKPISDLVRDVKNETILPIDILRCYGKIALLAHEKTNCLTEVMLSAAEEWLATRSINLDGPLAGIPVSLKDSIAVGGFDVSVGYSSNCGEPCQVDGTMVKILKAAGTFDVDVLKVSNSKTDLLARCYTVCQNKFADNLAIF